MFSRRLVLRRFEREAQATASLSSPHTIPVFDFGVTGDGTLYYVMELLAGLDLETLVREFGPLPADRAMFLLRQICHSLADAHSRGLVHRDVKPANIYACRMGLDFDFVKVSTSASSSFAQRDRPRPRRSSRSSTRRPGRTELPIPRELDELVLRCLEKDPDKRPQSAEELLAMAEGCGACRTWNRLAAKTWWQRHLPEHGGPLTMPVPSGMASRTRNGMLAH